MESEMIIEAMVGRYILQQLNKNGRNVLIEIAKSGKTVWTDSRPSIEQVRDVCCQNYNVDTGQLQSKSRDANICSARRSLIYLTVLIYDPDHIRIKREYSFYTNKSMKKGLNGLLAEVINKQHGVVTYYLNDAIKLLDVDKDLRNTYRYLEEKLFELHG